MNDEATGSLGKIADAGENVGDGIADGSKKGGTWLEKLGKKGGESGGLIEKAFTKAASAVGAAFTVKKLAEFAAECVNVASTAETSFAKVSTLLSGTDNTAFFDSIKKGSQETGVAVTDFAEAVYSALSASVDQAEAVDFTTNAMKLTKAGFTDAATSVDVLTTVLNAYGLEASQAASISDKLITTQNLGKTTVGELGQVLGRSIPTARAYNLSIDELLASYAVMTKNGNQAAESTTLINAMLNELGKSGTKTSEIIKDKTGKSFSQLMAEGTSLTDVLTILKSSANQSGLAINDLFGSAEAGKGANVLLNNIQDVVSATNQMKNSLGATESAYDKVMDTFSEKTAKLKNNFNLMFESIGEKLLPVASGFVDVLNSGFDVLFGNNAFKGQASSLEEASQKAQDYQNQIDAIYAKYDAGEEITDGDMYRINQLTGAMNDYLAQVDAFKNGTTEIAKTAIDPAQKFQEATEAYTASAEQLMQTYLETFEQTLGSVKSWFGPFDKAATSVKTSLSEITSNMQSQIDFNTQYADNLQYLADNGLGNLSKSLQAYGKDGAAYATTIAQALQEAGGATTEQGQAIVEQFSTLLSGVEESQSSVAENLVNMSGDFTTAMQQMSDDYASAIDGLDKSSEAEAAAKATMDKFLGAINAGKSGVLAAMSGLGSQMTSALQSSLGTVTMTVDVQFVGGSMPGRAIGLDYVPYNGYVAELHRGEAILNSYEADQWRRGRSGGEGQGITIVQNIQAVPQTPAQLAEATAAYFEQARWM